MSNNVSQQQSSFGTNFMAYGLMPTTTVVGTTACALTTHRGLKGAIQAQNNEAFRALDKQLKEKGVDVFTRSKVLAQTYDNYKDIVKAGVKETKKTNALIASLEKQKTKLETRKFVFGKQKKLDKLTGQIEQLKELSKADTPLSRAKGALDDIATKGLSKEAAEALDEAVGTIDKKLVSRALGEVGENIAEQGLKGAMKGAWNYTKTNFKNELGFKQGKLNYIMTALQFLPKLKAKVLPAFREKGIGAGMKETGKVAIQAATDLVGYAAGGAVGRTIGAFIGRLVTRGSGVGAKVGATLGDMICSMIVGNKITNTVNKMIGEDPESQAQQEASQVQQEASESKQANPQLQQYVQPAQYQYQQPYQVAQNRYYAQPAYYNQTAYCAQPAYYAQANLAQPTQQVYYQA